MQKVERSVWLLPSSVSKKLRQLVVLNVKIIVSLWFDLTRIRMVISLDVVAT